MSDFDERSGIVPCPTSWGQWWQTVDEVHVKIDVEKGTVSKNIRVDIKPKHLRVAVKGVTLIEGNLYSTIIEDDSVWTLEDRQRIEIILIKTDRTAKNAWPSLLDNQYEANPLVFDMMQQKLTLQRFQMENPGMDFSGATISGGYQGGGPELSH